MLLEQAVWKQPGSLVLARQSRDAPWPKPLSSSTTKSCHLQATSRAPRLTGVAPVAERTA